MKFSLSLLKRFLTTDAPLNVISETLTRIGLEVEGVEDKAAALAPFVVAHIKQAQPHPNATKLQICTVETTAGDLQIVCGAPNARAGIKVALAGIGTTIPTNGLVIKKSSIRDVESNGMLCSAAELGLSADAEGIIELPADATLGASIVDVLHLNDPIIELSITPNRGDCFGVYGIARDLAAAGIGTLLPIAAPQLPAPIAPVVLAEITDDTGCSEILFRRIAGVKNAPSPAWLQQILTAAGMRPISALVDITNYFTLAYGRPLHVFDAAKVSGKLSVRRANTGETLAALNEKTYQLTTNDCIIADEKSVLALGGIMGGIASGVSDATTDIILEVAMFNPERIALSGQHHQLISDARMRFERGVDPAFLSTADALATAMILELCGGSISSATHAGVPAIARAPIVWDVKFIEKRSGLTIDTTHAETMLRTLGFTVKAGAAIPPSWRHDVHGPEDIAEEVLRLIGYDNIPTISLPKPEGNTPPTLSAFMQRSSRARRVLATRGLFETISFAFISAHHAEFFGGGGSALTLQNPIAENVNTMRPNLLAGLMSAAHENLARAQSNIALFEMGSTFTGTNPADETMHAAGIRLGEGVAHWQTSAKPDIFSVKADALSVLETFGVNTDNCQISRNVPNYYHPGRAGVLSLGPKQILTYFGELHPDTLKQFDISVPVYAFEVLLENIPPAKAAKRTAAALSEYQTVTRDFAFIAPDSLEAGALQKAMKRAGGTHLTHLALFDVYRGKGVAEGHHSLAFTASLQAMDKTLSDADITAAADAMILAAKKLGAELRA